MKVEIFTDYDMGRLEQAMNEWLEEERENILVLDKLQSQTTFVQEPPKAGQVHVIGEPPKQPVILTVVTISIFYEEVNHLTKPETSEN